LKERKDQVGREIIKLEGGKDRFCRRRTRLVERMDQVRWKEGSGQREKEGSG
jgi:hypothetical protein